VRIRAGVVGLVVLCSCGCAAVAPSSVARSAVAPASVARSAGSPSSAAQPAGTLSAVARSAGAPSPAASSADAPTAAASAAGAPSARPAAAVTARQAGSQLVTVIAASYRATRAQLTAYRRVDGQWRRVFGPWAVWIGRNGMAAPGAKREGDGRTPSGTFGFGFFFGVDPNPGVHFPYRRIRAYDFWDDDPASPRYNLWVDSRQASPGADPEPMDVSAYDYGAVIAYNTARTPGRGSAIFLHINIGTPTAGCVTLPVGELLEILRWLNPADSPRITMGVKAPAA
jgi:L,D-peptidoglycan transpeptidase YkuD (ErfK/YbiS/YcfS/YnhG family)